MTDKKLSDLVQGLLVATRTLNVKTATSVISGLDVDDAVAGLSSGRVAELEEYEAELLLSPLFTPGDADRAACEAVISPAGLDSASLCNLQDELCAAELSCPVVYGVESGEMRIPCVVIERYVRLLGLSNPVPDGVAAPLEAVVTDEEQRRLAFSLARRPVWRKSQYAELLAACLAQMGQKSSFSAEKLDFLTSFVRSYRPKSVEKFLESLNNMIDAYIQDENHPIYSPNLARKQEKSLMPTSCNSEVQAVRMAMAEAFLQDFDRR